MLTLPTAQTQTGLTICVCTFRRPHLLQTLLNDLSLQTVQPERVVIVDGDPTGSDATSAPRLPGSETIRVSSNHPNLAYQRYLGWRVAQGAEILIYLDDDLRIRQPDCIATLVAPFSWSDRHVVGVTGRIDYPAASDAEKGVLADRRRPVSGILGSLVGLMGEARRIQSGELTAAGQRTLPRESGDYVRVGWLRGGVMAYRTSALSKDCFSDALFALTEIGCGLGEDSHLSRQVRLRGGEMLLANCAALEHPCSDAPKSYATQASRYGFAVAYSRRFLNDHYRGIDWPTRRDRRALLLSYAGNILLNWIRAVRSRRGDHLAYAFGYTRGAWQGVRVRPCVANLTPEVDWWADAERVLLPLDVHPPKADAQAPSEASRWN